MSIDVRGEVESVLAGEELGQLGIALLESFNDLQMIDDGARGAIALRDCGSADRAHVEQEIFRRINDGLRAAQCDDRGVKGDICVRILAKMFGRGRILKLIE